MKVLAWALASVAMAVGPAFAHDLGVVRVRVTETAPGRYHVEARVAANVDLAPPVFPERFATVGPAVLRVHQRSWIHEFTFVADGSPLADGDQLYFPWDRDGAFVRLLTAGGLEAGLYFEAASDGVRVPARLLLGADRSIGETLDHYLFLGVEHILLGWDHLAFVLCLCFIASGWRLVKLVSAFTLGHSLTLAAAVLGIARVPIAPVEACIALSIAIVAREAIAHGRRSLHGVGLVTAFGLLHGLGFASALNESGIQSSELLPGLVAFNLGVEIGQLGFLFAAIGTAVLALRIAPGLAKTRSGLPLALGTVAMFWTIERTLGMTILAG